MAEIDQINILQATLQAMMRAVEQLELEPELVLVDGNRAPKLRYPVQTLIGGDDKVDAISAASIIAKVWRDELMQDYASEFPGYGFESHKGYGTKAHLAALAELGPCLIHRQSFAPVAKAAAARRRVAHSGVHS